MHKRRQQRRLFDDADDFEMDDDLEQECGKSAVKKAVLQATVLFQNCRHYHSHCH